MIKAIWDSPQLKKFDILQLIESHKKQGSTINRACILIAEMIYLKFKGPKLTPQQIYSRYIYLKRKESKCSSVKPNIISRCLLDKNCAPIRMNELAYSLVDSEKLARQVKKLQEVQLKSHNPASIEDVIKALAEYFNVNYKTLSNRYYAAWRSIENNKKFKRVYKGITGQLSEEIADLRKTVDHQANVIHMLSNLSMIEFIKMKLSNWKLKDIRKIFSKKK